MKTEIKILRFFLENKEKCTIRELSKKVRADYKIVHTAVNRLLKKELLEKKKVGKAIELNFTNKFLKEVFEAELERRNEILKDKNIKTMLSDIINNLKTVNFILLLFGSYVKKTMTKHSDIDLMFIVPDEKFEKVIDNAISLLPLKIHYLVFSEAQFRNMKNSVELNVVKETIKNNIILYGMEQYYELIK